MEGEHILQTIALAIFLGVAAQVLSRSVAEQRTVNAKLETINYRGGVMELRILAPNVDSLDTIQKTISKNSDLSAEIQSANPEGNQVLGRLQIKRPGA